MVTAKVLENTPRSYRMSREVLPTPLSPTMTILKFTLDLLLFVVEERLNIFLYLY